MNAPHGSSAPESLREWWLTPQREGLQRVINPWEYRHLRAFGVARVFGGGVAASAGTVCLSYRAYGWAAFFMTIAAANVAGGCWYLTIDRAADA